MSVLVTSASRHGATDEIAAEIARVLRARGVECDVVSLEDAGSPAGYDAVVLGSAVYVGKWLEPARAFAERYRDALAERPTWLFSSGPVGDPPKPDPEAAVDLGDVERMTNAREHRVFAGKIDRRRLGRLERLVLRAVRAEDGDYRDWAAVREFAKAIADDCRPR